MRGGVLEESGVGMSAVAAVLESFTEAYGRAVEFTEPMFLLFLVVLLPVVLHVIKRTELRFRFPGIVTLWSFCLFAAGFTPGLYALGQSDLPRIVNILKIIYQLLFIMNMVYWLGWLYQKQEKTEEISIFYTGKGMLLAAVAALAIFALDAERLENYASYRAYYAVHSGEAYNFYQEYLKRIETIQNGGEEVLVEPLHYKPSIICIGDLSEDRWAEQNKAIAKWYGKESVAVRKE